MKTPSRASSKHFSSKHSALILGTVLTASTLFAGITLAQSTLTIPTNLSNAVIAIQRIVLSPSGTDIVNPSITLDGQNGSINTSGNIDL